MLCYNVGTQTSIHINGPFSSMWPQQSPCKQMFDTIKSMVSTNLTFLAQTQYKSFLVLLTNYCKLYHKATLFYARIFENKPHMFKCIYGNVGNASNAKSWIVIKSVFFYHYCFHEENKS